MHQAGASSLPCPLTLNVATTDSAFTAGYAKGQALQVPVAHHDGNYFADAETLDIDAAIERWGQRA